MKRTEIVMWIVCTLLACMVGATYAAQQPAHFFGLGGNAKAWIIGGELQQQFAKDGTFWVNGLRFSFEDREDAKAWAQQQVGKRVIVTIRVE